ncbi:transposase domain-containing protein [Kitasatospora sp. KL5]|uniref:transposase domain-containing protein n=1 Tax=Kitasatospora sp. KL5 TaxID=3425125 RepID=UPI003D6FCC7A
MTDDTTGSSRAADAAAVDLLVRTYPPELVDAVIASCGRTERQRRLLPARRMVYFVLGMALFSPDPYLDVMRRLEGGLRQAGLSQPGPAAGKAAIFQARERLGSGPLEELFRTAPRPSAAVPRAADPQWRGRPLRLLTEHRTAPTERTGPAPRLPVAGLVDCATGEILDALWDEAGAPATLLRSVEPGALLVSDGPAPDRGMAAAAAARGLGTVWRLPTARLPLQPERRLPDGTFLVRPRGLPLRVIGPGTVTNLLDPAQAPADELLDAVAAAARRSPALGRALLASGPAAAPLTSRTPDGIDQELYGRLLVHNSNHAGASDRLAPGTGQARLVSTCNENASLRFG